MGFQFPIPMYSVAVIFILFAVFASFFGMFVGSISKSVNQMLIIAQLFMLPGMLLCGTFFEFSVMPDWLQKVSFIFPQTWVSQTANHFSNGLVDIYFAGMFEYIVLLCLVISTYLFMVFKNRRTGTFY
jgi:ABC-2 type transport system permease protein